METRASAFLSRFSTTDVKRALDMSRGPLRCKGDMEGRASGFLSCLSTTDINQALEMSEGRTDAKGTWRGEQVHCELTSHLEALLAILVIYLPLLLV